MEIGSLGVPELLIILVVVLLLFGPRRLPEVARGLGQAVRGFREGVRGGLEDLEASMEIPAGRPEESRTVTAPDGAPSDRPPSDGEGGGERPAKAA
jgi:sec-independent protein translocase protein TatA